MRRSSRQKGLLPAITNSLLRVDGVRGVPKPPFERPRDDMDFFVLELGTHDDVASWCRRTEALLNTHSKVLRQMRTAGAELTLFVESAAGVPVIRFEALFLGVLSKAGISLECSQEAV